VGFTVFPRLTTYEFSPPTVGTLASSSVGFLCGLKPGVGAGIDGERKKKKPGRPESRADRFQRGENKRDKARLCHMRDDENIKSLINTQHGMNTQIGAVTGVGA